MAVVLVDCDNFFASCERVLSPELYSKPIAVLSNNDGCIIARTTEVKKIGVTMGQPYHECRQLLETINAEVLSANFLLYRQFAKRIQAILKNIPSSHTEVYSIDESFLDVDESIFNDDAEAWAIMLREHILKWTAIPVSIGIASSRSLAKLAILVAKKSDKGVFVIDNDDKNTTKDDLLKAISIQDVWGVGRRMAPKFRACGILTAYDLTVIDQNSNKIKLLDRTGRDLISELKGWSRAEYEENDRRKTMMHTRSFGSAVSSLDDVRSVFAQFTAELTQKLWRYKLATGHISVFLVYKVNLSNTQKLTVSRALKIAPTNDLLALETHIDSLVGELFEEGVLYKKAGIVFGDLSPEDQYQLSFSSSKELLNKSESAAKMIQQIDKKLAVHVSVGTELLGRGVWKGKRENISQFNHSSWNSIPVVKNLN